MRNTSKNLIAKFKGIPNPSLSRSIRRNKRENIGINNIVNISRIGKAVNRQMEVEKYNPTSLIMLVSRALAEDFK